VSNGLLPWESSSWRFFPYFSVVVADEPSGCGSSISDGNSKKTKKNKVKAK
jgi:hypothetical protein